jgi:exoribonuclease R
MEQNIDYEINYTTFIENLYRPRDEIALDLLSDNIIPHEYSVLNRVDLTKLDVYSIDPEGCEDADDAFSIYKEKNVLYLAIHIADPTEYINLKSNLWKYVSDRVISHYPSNRRPIHMIPREIMEKSSLMVNNKGNIKNAITLLMNINNINYQPGNIKLLFTKIKVNKENALSYKSACEQIDSNEVLSIGLKISNALQNLRGEKTIGIKLNEVSQSYPVYVDGIPSIYKNNNYEVKMKQMIAEFAILANSYVGEYLKLNLDGKGIFRTCEAKELISNMYNLSGNELLNEIIMNGIQAEYLSQNKSHDLVGMPNYSHFTSPIRRLSDCVCHYLLKYIYLRINDNNLIIPFSNDELDILSDKCLYAGKNMKKIQYNDIKFRLIHTMFNILLTREIITLTYFITSYNGLFLNLIICKMDEHDIYMSYTIRTRIFNGEITKNHKSVKITKVNCLKKYDEGCIPELEKHILEYK